MSDASGTAKILGEAVGDARDRLAHAAGEEVDQAEQLELIDEDRLGLPDAGEVMALLPECGGDYAMAIAEHRRRAGKGGRKKGAVNRRSADLAAYLQQFGPDPAVAMMRLLARPVEMLAAELSCSRAEAADKQIRVAAELMPYFHGKKPQAIEFTGRGGMSLMIVDGSTLAAQPAPVDGGDVTPQIAFPDPEQNQSVSDVEQGQSE